MINRRSTTAREVARFGVAGLAALGILCILVLAVVARVAEGEALRSAKERARLAGYGIVEPVLVDSILTESSHVGLNGQPALGTLDTAVVGRVLSDHVVRVKVWGLDGRIVYSDEPRLIGKKFAAKADHQTAVETGQMGAEVADTDGPENVFERGNGKLLEVYLPVRTVEGTPLIYEQYEQYDSITGNSRRLLRRLALPVAFGVVVLWLIQLPLARRLARRVQDAEAGRAEMADAALFASARERERIAAELHDGVVQDLAGLSFELSALSAAASSPESREVLDRSAGLARTSLQKVRSSLVDLHPQSTAAVGLTASLEQLSNSLRRHGIDVGVEVDPEIERTKADDDVQALVYRMARELLRNAEEHSGATRVQVSVSAQPDTMTLVISDNGRGFNSEVVSSRRAEGHVGLELHKSLISRVGGTVTIDTGADQGATITVSVPRRPTR